MPAPATPSVVDLLNAIRAEKSAPFKCKTARILEAQPPEVQAAMQEAFEDYDTFSGDVLLKIFRQTIGEVGDNILRKHRNHSCGCTE